MTVQYDVSGYFPSDSITNQKPIPHDIPELIKLICENKQNLNFIMSLYNECFNTQTDDPLFDKHIRESISKYEKPHNELFIYVKSEYYVFDMGEYFIKTLDGNYRNWIYAFEIDTEYNFLTNKITEMDRQLSLSKI
tara:strand:+ start:577 stop:984 length:408 start_codon:yes stop_codon:yes gene_type:complete